MSVQKLWTGHCGTFCFCSALSVSPCPNIPGQTGGFQLPLAISALIPSRHSLQLPQIRSPTVERSSHLQSAPKIAQRVGWLQNSAGFRRVMCSNLSSLNTDRQAGEESLSSKQTFTTWSVFYTVDCSAEVTFSVLSCHMSALQLKGKARLSVCIQFQI